MMLVTKGEYTPASWCDHPLLAARGIAGCGAFTATMSMMPTVNVRFFANLRDLVGAREITLTLPDGATIDHLRARVGEAYPVVQPLLPNVVYAVGEEYVPVTHALREGDLVALIPPVSGGC